MAATSEQYAGVADPPVQFPNIVSAPAVENANESAGVVVAVATLVVNSGARFPALNVDTPPPPPPPPPPVCAPPIIYSTASVPVPVKVAVVVVVTH